MPKTKWKPKPYVPAVEKLLYTKEDAGYALSRSTRSIDYMIANKRLSFRRFGNKIFIPVADIRRAARMDILEGCNIQELKKEKAKEHGQRDT